MLLVLFGFVFCLGEGVVVLGIVDKDIECIEVLCCLLYGFFYVFLFGGVGWDKESLFV